MPFLRLDDLAIKPGYMGLENSQIFSQVKNIINNNIFLKQKHSRKETLLLV
jgi:hypothetical protein